MKFRICVVSGIVFLTGCVASKKPMPGPVLAKRYYSALPTIDKSGDSAVINVLSEVLPGVQPDEDNSKTVYDLTGEGQKAYIKVIGEKTKNDIGQFTDAMNQKFFEDEDNSGIEDISQRKLHIVFSVSQKDFYQLFPQKFSLGDRIEYLKMTLTLDTPYVFKFSNWDQFNTQYGQYNIAGRSFTGTKEININPSIPFTAGALSLGSLDKKSELTESDSLKRRFVLLNGVLQDDSLTIEQSGTPEINLTGNSSTDVTMDLRSSDFSKDITQSFVFDNLKTKKGFSAPKDVGISKDVIIYPQLSKDITANLTCTYSYRHIIYGHGDDTQAESDDDIQYYHGTTNSQKIILINKDEITQQLPRWGILIGNNSLMAHDTIELKDEELLFSTFSDADNFLEWLLYTRRSVKSGTVTIDKYQFITKDIDDKIFYFNKKIEPKKPEIKIHR